MENSMTNLIKEIKATTVKQRGANKVDEIRVMQTMLNDPDFSISIYDKNKGLIGSRCPRQEAINFVAGACSSITGIDSKSASELTNSYEFTKKDAQFFINMSRDFVTTYVDTGRKLPIVQSETSQAVLLNRHIDEKQKVVPKTNETVKVSAYDKIISQSKCPKYNK